MVGVVEPSPVDQFAFEGGEEALGHGVVVAIADRSHGGSDAELAASGPEAERGVLRALVGVMDRLSIRPASPDRHLEGLEVERGPEVGLHGPTDHAAADDVEHDGEIEEAPRRRYVSNVGDPELVLRHRVEVGFPGTVYLLPAPSTSGPVGPGFLGRPGPRGTEKSARPLSSSEIIKARETERNSTFKSRSHSHAEGGSCRLARRAFRRHHPVRGPGLDAPCSRLNARPRPAGPARGRGCGGRARRPRGTGAPAPPSARARRRRR